MYCYESRTFVKYETVRERIKHVVKRHNVDRVVNGGEIEI